MPSIDASTTQNRRLFHASLSSFGLDTRLSATEAAETELLLDPAHPDLPFISGKLDIPRWCPLRQPSMLALFCSLSSFLLERAVSLLHRLYRVRRSFRHSRIVGVSCGGSIRARSSVWFFLVSVNAIDIRRVLLELPLLDIRGIGNAKVRRIVINRLKIIIVV